MLYDFDLSQREKSILRKRLGFTENGEIQDSQVSQFPSYYIHFPAYVEDMAGNDLQPISVKGLVPSKGDRIYFSSFMKTNIVPGYDHSYDFRKWYVKKVVWSVTVQTTKKEQLLYDNIFHVEVIVDYYRWSHWFWELKLKYYHDPLNKLKNYFRKKNAKYRDHLNEKNKNAKS